jgi:hypothetical protein
MMTAEYLLPSLVDRFTHCITHLTNKPRVFWSNNEPVAHRETDSTLWPNIDVCNYRQRPSASPLVMVLVYSYRSSRDHRDEQSPIAECLEKVAHCREAIAGCKPPSVVYPPTESACRFEYFAAEEERQEALRVKASRLGRAARPKRA